MNFEINETEAYQCSIYIAGNMNTIEETCPEFCERGACVSIQPTTFVYTTGREFGAEIKFISYARFPKGRDKWNEDAIELAKLLIEKCHQHSCTVIDDQKSIMLTRKFSKVKEK